MAGAFLLISTLIVHAQTGTQPTPSPAKQAYDREMDQASKAIRQKDYCGAFAIFQSAFADTAARKITGGYDLFSGARSAARCGHEDQAMEWLERSLRQGVGLNPGELEYMQKDSAFLSMHRDPRWTSYIQSVKTALAQRQTTQKRQADDWIAGLKARQIPAAQNRVYHKAGEGFALYYIAAGNIQVPYLVYVPSSYTPGSPAPAIVYLHGGVNNAVDFNEGDPLLAFEPIFGVGKRFNSIVIYPFGRRTFGWVRQPEAFQNVLDIIAQVRRTYDIDSARIVLGGMSNGGTAAFWFASRKPGIFRGFYAFSAMPRLDTGAIPFDRINGGKPLYTLNAKDDDQFPYDSVYAIYRREQAIARDWHFQTLPSGGHGFIYARENQAILDDTFTKLLGIVIPADL